MHDISSFVHLIIYRYPNVGFSYINYACFHGQSWTRNVVSAQSEIHTSKINQGCCTTLLYLLSKNCTDGFSDKTGGTSVSEGSTEGIAIYMSSVENGILQEEVK